MVVKTYCEVHDEPDPSNDMTPGTHETIALGNTGNLNGIYKFFCLKTGRILKWRKWTEYPIPKQVVNTVNKCRINSKKA